MEFSSVDTIWVLLGAILVFFMQGGFAMVEVGLTRNKNTANLVMKNLMDFCIGSLVFWFIGFGFMFAGSGPLIGGLDLFVRGDYGGSYPSNAYLIFQTVFCGTAATIISGATAERTKFQAYCLYTLLMSMVVYPISGHWIWGGGWLAKLGFHDFAGSTAVHMVGGVAALVGAWMLGPRIGKYDEKGNSSAIPGQSLAMAALGVFILWFAWFGFNGCSTVSATGDNLVTMSTIMVTTNLAAAAGATVMMILTWLRYGRPDVSMTLNGALGGLVAITAGCDAVSPAGAAIIGGVSAVVLMYGIEFVDKKLRIDDPVGAFGVHGVCGALGTVLTGLFALDGGLFYGGGAAMLGVQILGVAAVAAWVGVAMFIVYSLINKTVGLRVSPAEEISGLDVSEHDIPAGSYPGFASGRFISVYKREVGGPRGQANDDSPKTSPRAYNPKAKTDRKMTKVEIITRPEKFAELKVAMHEIGITGMTVTKVMGCGVQSGAHEYYRGVKMASNLLPKVALEIVVSKVPVETVVETAKKVLYTGNIGDGKIFISDIEDVVKVRTGEQGYDALQYPEMSL
jgi:Amt family ammonium transporter